MKHVISVVSGKGGVGKSTIAVNIATLLSMQGASVILLDADFYNPCVFFHLGLSPHQSGLQELLEGKAGLEDALSIHPVTGLRCISASLKFYRDPKTKNFKNLIDSLNYDYIMIDCAPGFSSFVEDAIDASNEVIVVQTPDLPSVTAAMKLSSVVRDKCNADKKISFVVNRVANQPYELHPREIEDACKAKLNALVPEDPSIPRSLSLKTPVTINSPNAPASRIFKHLANDLLRDVSHSHESLVESMQKSQHSVDYKRKEGILDGFFNFIRRLLEG